MGHAFFVRSTKVIIRDGQNKSNVECIQHIRILSSFGNNIEYLAIRHNAIPYSGSNGNPPLGESDHETAWTRLSPVVNLLFPVSLTSLYVERVAL